MGAVEHAVDAAALFLVPFVDTKGSCGAKSETDIPEARDVTNTALAHLQAIHTADLAADPNAPYDASLAGVVYKLLDLIVVVGILPNLSPGVAFSQRPKSVLGPSAVRVTPIVPGLEFLSEITWSLAAILEHKGSGVQPLLSQRVLPDIISGLIELSFSPASDQEIQTKSQYIYRKAISETPSVRLLTILTTFLQQPLPAWLKPVISQELSMIPLRQKGIRHTVEFLSLSYLAKNSEIPRDAAGSQAQVPIPLEAVNQASRLLVLPPSGFDQDGWLRKLAPQLLWLLDGEEGRELSRAAGVIIAGGILSKRTTGAPGTSGWELFAEPLHRSIHPKVAAKPSSRQGIEREAIVSERDLNLALKRLLAIVSSSSHAGLIRRLIGSLLLPLWAILNHAHARSVVDQEWVVLSQTLLSRYFAAVCDAKPFDNIAKNLFWDGAADWTFGPGSSGGIEIRWRSEHASGSDAALNNILSCISNMDPRINTFVSLLVDAKLSDDIVGSIFLRVTDRWLTLTQSANVSLTSEPERDPLAALVDAKLSEVLVSKFKEHLARSPRHVIELMGQLIANFVGTQSARYTKSITPNKLSRTVLSNIHPREELGPIGKIENERNTTDDDELVLFALSITTTLLSSRNFRRTPETTPILQSMLPPLEYLSQSAQTTLSPSIRTAASALLHHIKPPSTDTTSSPMSTTDPLAEHKATLRAITSDLTSDEPPMRTWALHTLHKVIKDPVAFHVIDLPSMTHRLLSASLADPESYVHTAAVPVLVDLAIRAPLPVVKILVDAFIDVDERSLKLREGLSTEESEKQLGHALDFRLRVGEVLNGVVLDGTTWEHASGAAVRYGCARLVFDACLSTASRRGQRAKTSSARAELKAAERQTREEGEAAWGGPIPNLFESDGTDHENEAERDALLEIVQTWEQTGLEEDVRIRASSLSIVSTILEHRLNLLRQPQLSAALQMVILILTVETSDAKAMLRRAGALVALGVLRAMDAALEGRKEGTVGMSNKQLKEIERVIAWVKAEDKDALVRDHAAVVIESLDTLRLKKLYKMKDEGFRLGPSLGLEGALRGIDITPSSKDNGGRRKMIVEEVE